MFSDVTIFAELNSICKLRILCNTPFYLEQESIVIPEGDFSEGMSSVLSLAPGSDDSV